jgi:hypothetical protein
MASLFGFGPSAKVEIELAGTADGEKRKIFRLPSLSCQRCA